MQSRENKDVFRSSVLGKPVVMYIYIPHGRLTKLPNLESSYLQQYKTVPYVCLVEKSFNSHVRSIVPNILQSKYVLPRYCQCKHINSIANMKKPLYMEI